MRHPVLLASLLLVPSLLLAQDQDRLREPFLRVRIQDRAALSSNPRLAGCWQTARAVAAEMKVEGRLDDLEVIWSALPMHAEVFGIFDAPDRLVFGALMPATQFSFSERFRAAGEASTVTIGGASWTETRHGRERLLEGDRDARHMVLFESRSEGEAATVVEGFLAAVERESPATRRLQKSAPPGACTALLNVEQLLAATPQAAMGMLGIVKTLLGGRFAGVSVGIQPTTERLVVELHTDLLPNQGLIAGLFARDAEGVGLAAWLPDDAPEFANLRLSMDGITKMARFLGGLAGASFDPADWNESFARLRGTDALALLEEHLTGEVQVLTVPTRAEAVPDADAPASAVAMFGTADGSRCLEAVHKVLAAVDGAPVLAADAAFGEGAYTVAVDGEVRGRIVARGPFLAMAPADATSTAMLRAMLATRGEGKMPAALRQRLPAESNDAVPVALGLLHLLSSLESRLSLAAMVGRRTPKDEAILKVLIAALQQNFAGDAGLLAARAEARADGLRTKLVW